jgi:RNA polymerase sigma factor (sigma-70 family)
LPIGVPEFHGTGRKVTKGAEIRARGPTIRNGRQREVRTVDTQFLRRLKRGDDAAWFELWEIFGPALERMVERFAHRCFTPETVRDVSQETLLRLAREIHRFDPTRGTRFSTWLFQIAKHVVCGEFTFRNAKKRGSGVRPGAIDPAREPAGEDVSPPDEYERAVFRAKVYRAMRIAEQRLDFLVFEVYKARILRGMMSKDIAVAMGISEPTVSRYLKKARKIVKKTIGEVVHEYSFTKEEEKEVEGANLNTDDDLFDSSLADIYATEEQSRKGYDTISRAVQTLGARRR